MLQQVKPVTQGGQLPNGDTVSVGQQSVKLPVAGQEPWRQSLFSALLEARGKYGGATVVANDFQKTSLTYDRLTLGALLLGDKLADLGPPDVPLGILLPNASGVAAVFFACQASGRVPAMLNYSS
ncbi:MAG: hypothetical protein KI785_00465, partial [Devosiaceae bacterium]|nr:hypothetical protein [Devosiaceae bacterium MH13]